ncbi:hypothetical protein, partial [Streptomyces rimosus]|uniref:hypothetical protein n=1 Tax=Streptomyces rimosus TaxID=1927 RepID=UPI001F3D15C0
MSQAVRRARPACRLAAVEYPLADDMVGPSSGRTAGESRIRSSPSSPPGMGMSSLTGARLAVGGGLAQRGA